MSLEDGYHDVGGVLDGEIPGPGPDRGHREAREFPLARLFQRRAPRARHPVAGHWLGVASDDGVDHELRRQVAATGGDHRRAHRELLLELPPARERRAAYRPHPARGPRPPAATTAAPAASSFWSCSPRVNAVPPTVSSRRRAGVVGSRRVVDGRTTAVAARNARSSTTTRITRRRPPASGDTSA